MKKGIKPILVLLGLALCALSARAQESKGLLGEGKYQWGLAAKAESAYLGTGLASVDVMAGKRLDRKNYVGLQTGITRVSADGCDPLSKKEYDFGLPILADYIHYFPIGKKKTNSFTLGAEAGAILVQDLFDGFDAAVKFGFDFSLGRKAPHLFLDLRIKPAGGGYSIGIAF